jgi:hypothetical protein
MDRRVAQLRQRLLDEAQRLNIERSAVEDEARWNLLTRQIHALERAAMVLNERIEE